MCRKFHGAAFATIAGAPRSKFRLVKGNESLKEYRAENGTTRTFCRHCGSSLMFHSPRAQNDVIEIALGTVDGDVEIKPNAHIFVGSSANWTTIEDNLPQYQSDRTSARVKRV